MNGVQEVLHRFGDIFHGYAMSLMCKTINRSSWNSRSYGLLMIRKVFISRSRAKIETLNYWKGFPSKTAGRFCILNQTALRVSMIL